MAGLAAGAGDDSAAKFGFSEKKGEVA